MDRIDYLVYDFMYEKREWIYGNGKLFLVTGKPASGKTTYLQQISRLLKKHLSNVMCVDYELNNFEKDMLLSTYLELENYVESIKESCKEDDNIWCIIDDYTALSIETISLVDRLVDKGVNLIVASQSTEALTNKLKSKIKSDRIINLDQDINIRELIKNELLVTSEISEMYGITRQGIVKNKKLIPIMKTKNGYFYLKEDVISVFGEKIKD